MLFLLAAGENPIPRLPEMVALLLGCAAVAFACVRIGVAPILGFLLAGVLLGPFGLAVVDDDALVQQLAEVGVVLLLFTIGIEFSLEKLARISKLIFVAGTAQVVGTVAAVAGALMLFGVDWRPAVFTGALVSLSSTAIVLKLLAADRRTGTDEGQAALGVLIFQDLAVVAMVMVVPMLGVAAAGAEEHAGGGGMFALVWALAKAGGIVALVLLGARRLVPPVIERVAKTCSAEVFLLTLVSVCFGLAWLTSLAGVSLALGAFLAGLLISESRFSHHAFGEVMPLQVLFSAVFFASVGMRLDPAFLWDNPLAVLGCVAAVVAVKAAVTAAGVKLAGGRWAVAGAAGLLTAQVGEFAFVLQATGAAAGLAPGGMAERGVNLFIAAAVVSMLLTPLLSSASRRLTRSPESADRVPKPARNADGPRIWRRRRAAAAGGARGLRAQRGGAAGAAPQRAAGCERGHAGPGPGIDAGLRAWRELCGPRAAANCTSTAAATCGRRRWLRRARPRPTRWSSPTTSPKPPRPCGTRCWRTSARTRVASSCSGPARTTTPTSPRCGPPLRPG